MLEKAYNFFATASAGLLLSCGVLNTLPAIADIEPMQVTLDIDATSALTFSELVYQAESLVETELAQRFQSNPAINEIQITVLGDRNGQLASILSVRVTRNAWQTNSDIYPWTRYFTVSSALLGFSNSAPMMTRRPVVVSRAPSAPLRLTTSEAVERAREARLISEEEYWRRIDELD